MDTPQIDPEKLSLRANELPFSLPSERRRPSRFRRRDWFIKGPVPGPWIAKAAALGGRALKAALAIYCEAGMKRTRSVRLSAETLKRFSLRPQGTRRALAGLVAAGLISVNQRPGRRALITIVVNPQ